MRLSEVRLSRVKELAEQIGNLGARLNRPVQLMEVCGTHSHVIGRYGLRQLLPEWVRLISGPGCPVCVTTGGQIEMALEVVRRGGVVATFGDMMRVPGASSSLAEARSAGGEVQVVYSPQQALEIALARPNDAVVFVAVGFETTAPAVAAVVKETWRAGLENLSFLSLHKTIPPALEALMADEDVHIDGFLCPGHVSVIIGSNAYRKVAERYAVPCVVAGFEPEDVLLGVKMLLAQIAEGRAEVENAYARVVRPEGNLRAQALIDEVFEVTTAQWRGLGEIAKSGLVLREEFAALDAGRRFSLKPADVPEPCGCCCGEVLRGVIRPAECGLFGTVCTPVQPVGPCMVSSEGACAAAYKYERIHATRG
jgi:hydrogenase expression/formation protein HypD